MVVSNLGTISICSLVAIFFFMSIIFPTIFSLGIIGLGGKTKKGSSIIMMSVIGGGISPYAISIIADAHNTADFYAIPLIIFIAIFLWILFVRDRKSRRSTDSEKLL